MHGHGFNWLTLLFSEEIVAHYGHVVMGVIVAALLILTTWIARVRLVRAMQVEDGGVIPEEKLTYRGFFEIIADSLYKMVEGTLGEHDAARYFPLIGTLFLFIFVSNLMGLIPGLLPPTGSINTTLALGIFVFFYYNYLGFKENGFGYIKHFFGPVAAAAPLIFVIELISHIVRPLALGLRLRGNIHGDHLVLGIFSDLAPWGVPVVFYGLGLFVAFVQAFVFCLLTMIYISLSTAHDH